MVKFIIINGVPGSGKTTTVNRLIAKDIIPKPYLYIEEFQVTPEGNQVLKNYLSSKIDVVSFQKQAIDYYVNNIKPHKDENVTIVLDKHPDMGLLLYSYIDLKSGKITQQEYDEISKYHDEKLEGVIPRSMCGYIVNNEIDALPECIRLIRECKDDYLMIFIDASIKAVKERIIQRSSKRNHEKDVEYYIIQNMIQKLYDRYVDICSATLVIGDVNKSYIVSNNILNPITHETRGDPIVIKRVIIDYQFISYFRIATVPTYIMMNEGNLIEIHDYYKNLLKVETISDNEISKYNYNTYVMKLLKYPSIETMKEDVSYVKPRKISLVEYGKMIEDVSNGLQVSGIDNNTIHLLRYYNNTIGFTQE